MAAQKDYQVIKTAKDAKSAKKESMVKPVIFCLPSFFLASLALLAVQNFGLCNRPGSFSMILADRCPATLEWRAELGRFSNLRNQFVCRPYLPILAGIPLIFGKKEPSHVDDS